MIKPETFYETVQSLKGEMPTPREVDFCDYYVPYFHNGYYGRIKFEPEYFEGLCIGWKLKEDSFKI
jgi:hypothetical protein